MASAPPVDSGHYYGGHPQPPSYEETLATPQYPYGYAPPPVDGKMPGPAYPPQTFNQPYPQQPVTAVAPPVTMQTVQTVYVHPVVFGDVSVEVHCPVCAKMVMTRVERNSGVLTWISCLGISVVGCIYGCCLIPFCVDSLKDAHHHCPSCSSLLGVYKRL
ncbi:hypothetical protein ACEWY4_002529 [Coilia grayii]|uniref:LITAF domain-containing protein n=1 Tax=Coilia grayii TaxID=363190 RepID=A0ABD1KNM5_9TELE